MTGQNKIFCYILWWPKFVGTHVLRAFLGQVDVLKFLLICIWASSALHVSNKLTNNVVCAMQLYLYIIPTYQYNIHIVCISTSILTSVSIERNALSFYRQGSLFRCSKTILLLLLAQHLIEVGRADNSVKFGELISLANNGMAAIGKGIF